MDMINLEASVGELSERVRPHIEQAKQQLGRLNARVTSVIKEHPAACLLGALAAGYLVARVARRQSWWS